MAKIYLKNEVENPKVKALELQALELKKQGKTNDQIKEITGHTFIFFCEGFSSKPSDAQLYK